MLVSQNLALHEQPSQTLMDRNNVFLGFVAGVDGAQLGVFCKFQSDGGWESPECVHS